MNKCISAGLLLFAYASTSAQNVDSTKGAQSPIILGNGNNTVIGIYGNGNKVVLGRVSPKTKSPIKHTLQSAAKAYLGNGISWAGLFIPAHDPPPVTRCQIPPNSTTVYVGNGALTVSCVVSKEHLNERLTPQSLAGTCNIFSDSTPPPAPSSADPTPLISVVQTGTTLMIDGRLLGPNGELRALFRGGNIYINKQTISLAERKDSSTLNIFDKDGREVFHVRYSAPHTVEVEGDIYFKSGRLLKAEGGSAHFSPSVTASAECLTNVVNYSFGISM